MSCPGVIDFGSESLRVRYMVDGKVFEHSAQENDAKHLGLVNACHVGEAANLALMKAALVAGKTIDPVTACFIGVHRCRDGFQGEIENRTVERRVVTAMVLCPRSELVLDLASCRCSHRKVIHPRSMLRNSIIWARPSIFLRCSMEVNGNSGQQQ